MATVQMQPPRRRRRRRRWGPRIALLLGLLFAAGVIAGLLALSDRADANRVPPGLTIARLKLGGLSRQEALRRLERRYERPALRAVTVTVAGRAFRLPAARARVRMDLQGAVDRAIAEGRRDDIAARAWRTITNGKLRGDVPVPVRVDRRRVRAFVTRVGERVARPTRDPALQVAVVRVRVRHGRDGRRLDAPVALTRRIVRAFRDPYSARDLRGATARVAPVTTKDDVWAAHPTVLTISRHQNVVRVFRRGRQVKRYRATLGTRRSRTPYGLFGVQVLRPAPRWIGFDGAVGIDSRGVAGGNVRVRARALRFIYSRVTVGTSVLVGA